MTMRVPGNKEGNGEGGKGNDSSDKGVGQETAMATKRAMVTATRVAGDKECNGNKGVGQGMATVTNRVMATVTRVLVATKKAMATKRAMATATKVGGNVEGNGIKEGNDDSNEGGGQRRGQGRQGRWRLQGG
jgi:hypothetical protein